MKTETFILHKHLFDDKSVFNWVRSLRALCGCSDGKLMYIIVGSIQASVKWKMVAILLCEARMWMFNDVTTL